MKDASSSVDLAKLPDLPASELSSLWRQQLGGASPDHLPKSLLARLLAYRLQVQQHGDLPKPAVTYLDRIADDLEQGLEPALPYPDHHRLKPGVVLVREHGGEMHRVMVLGEGYAWKGKSFASLSAVAKAITGTTWNGQRFFGLNCKEKTAP